MNDYECLYLQTIYSSSDAQVACTSPRIPEFDRVNLMSDFNNYPSFTVSFQVGGKYSFTCDNPADCQIVYTPWNTPIINTLEPSHFYVGQNLTFRVSPNSQNYAGLGHIKIGVSNCIVPSLDSYVDNSADMVLTCVTGGNIVGKVTNFTLSFTSGFTKVSSFFLKQDVDATLSTFSNYYFKVFPRIDSLKFYKGSPNGGQIQVISGVGFVDTQTKVSIVNDICNIISVNYTNVVCVTSPSTIDPLVTNPFFVGSRGLRWRIYPNFSSIAAMNSIPGFPNNLTYISRDDILMETSTAPMLINNYCQHFSGLFKAVYDGSYRFWDTSDDGSQVLLSNDTSSANNVKIIDFNGFTLYNDFISQYNYTRSKWIILSANQLYNIDIYHCQGSGADHFRLGVEIDQTNNPLNSTLNPLPNQAFRTVSIKIVPNSIFRDVYEISIPSMTINAVSINRNTDIGTTTLSINPSWSASQFRNYFSNFSKESRLIIRKLYLNENSQYYLGPNDSFDDSSFTSDYNFGDMNINFDNLTATTLSNITTVSTGTKSGIVFFILIDKKDTDRVSSPWENLFYLKSNPSSIQAKFNKKQSVSPGLTGYFKLNFLINNLNYTTQKINATNINQLGTYIDALPVFTSKSQVYFGDMITDSYFFYIRFGTYSNITISVLMNDSDTRLQGGRDRIVNVNMNDILPEAGKKSLFFMPIPSDFLRIKNTNPQVIVSVNGYESACMNCSYNFELSSNMPKVLSSTYDSTKNTLTMIVDKNFMDSSIQPFMKIGNNIINKVNVTYSNANNIISYIGNLSSRLIGGSYTPILSCDLGDLISAPNISLVNITFTIGAITPNKANSLGGTLISIIGTNFPLVINQDLSVSAGGSNCSVQTVSNTQITCITGKQVLNNNNSLQISYLGLTVSADLSAFSYITSPTKSIQSVIPSSVAPGEKQTITILFTSDISAFNISGISVKIVHTTRANYHIMMNVFSVVNNTMKVRFGGAAIGNYSLVINLDNLTNVDSAPTFTCGFSIDSMSPTIGSINGGTIITLKGTNFLSTQINQMIFIGKTPCVYVNNTVSTIVCTTAVPNVNTPIDTDQSVEVDQMIQYASVCNVNSASGSTLLNGCYFKYSTSMTAIINNVVSSTSDFAFGLNDQIIINGNNFVYANAPTVLNFKWGQITVTSTDKMTQINGTVSNITDYGFFTFDFYNDYGIATQNPNGTSKGYSNVQIFLKKPALTITNLSPYSIGEYGSIFKFYSSVNDFTTYPNNLINICGTPCLVLPKNILADENSNFQCILSQPTIQTKFTSCDVVVSYYQLSLNLTLPSKPGANKTNNNQIYAVLVNNVDISSTTFTANGIADSSNFNVKVLLNNQNINLNNLKLIVDNRYVFPSAAGYIDPISKKATYNFTLTNGLPAGSFACSIFEDTIGFLLVPNQIVINNVATSGFNLNVNAKFTPPSTLTTISSSFNGGISGSISGINFNRLITALDTTIDKIVTANADNSAFQKVLVCGFPAAISSYNSSSISFYTPNIIKYDFFQNKSILANAENLISPKFSYISEVYFNETISSTNYAKLFDQNIFSYFIGSVNSFIGIKIKQAYIASKFKIMLTSVKIHVGDLAKPGDYNKGFIEGSLDNVTWTNISNLPQNLPFLYNTFNINYAPGSPNLFKYIRLNPKANTVYISEIAFFGKIVYDDSTSTTASCNISIVDNFNNVVIPNYNVIYDTALTLMLKKITPLSGKSVGGDTINLVLSGNSLKGTEAIIVTIFGVRITSTFSFNNLSRLLRFTETTLYNTITFTTPPRDNSKMDFTQPLTIFVPGYGNVYTDTLNFRFLDRWSDTATWGGEFIPANGETAYVINCDVLLDVPNINLNTLVIENGSLIVEDGRDYQMKAKIILVRSGSFIVGTETLPFQSKFTLTLTATRQDPTLPKFGNKVLAVLEGNLVLQGIPRVPVWTVLQKTANPGENKITVSGPIDWVAGEEIVIASSSTNPFEPERMTILSVDNKLPLLPVVTLSSPLLYTHYGDVETYGTSDTIDMRAEVILLTRNIVIQGDPDTSDNEQYGSHIMLTSMSMDMNLASSNPFYGKLAYIEVKKAGQAFQLGRYPIHFHMIGDVSGSYVKGCSIHDTFNRAITVHGVKNFLLDSNVGYNSMGHMFFIEDGVETNNIFLNNVGILSRASFALLNTDYTPATFWITNPSNNFIGNRACGSEFYGFWFEIPTAPTGVSLGVKTCPRQYPLGIFKDNVAHSNGNYGIRLFPEYTPINKPCQAVDGINVFTVTALFQNITLYKNKLKGLVTERIGDMVFDTFRLADNGENDFEVSDMIIFDGVQPRISNTFVVGKTKNPAKEPWNRMFRTGITTPRKDNFKVSNIRFYNFGFDNTTSSLFASCSRCDIAGPSTDSDARTIYFEKIQTDGSESRKVRWIAPRRGIFVDLDGTLTGQSNPGFATAYYPHLLTPNCKRSAIWDDGLICDNTAQIRRIAFSQQTPSGIFNGQDLKILRFQGSLDTLDNSTIANVTNYSVIGFKALKLPSNGWAVPFVTGYNYMLTFGQYGLDFNRILVERSYMWDNTDKNINLMFNYTYRRDDFSVFGFDNTNNQFNVTNATAISLMNDMTQTLPYGTYLNNIAKRQLYLRVTPYNPQNLLNLGININAIQCLNNDCGIVSPGSFPAENFTRNWSDSTNWPNNLVPIDGDNVEVKAGWNMVLDVSTASLKNLTINGNLTFDYTKDNLELKAKIIFVYQGRLTIGTQDNPFLKNAKITLTGDKFSNNIAISNNIQLTNKVLLNVGNLSIAGENRGPYKSRLLASAKIGDSLILVSSGLNWKAKDEVIITTTNYLSNQTERFTILSYNSTTGYITLNSTFNYPHYGSAGPTIIIDNPIPAKKTLDERAEVYMITRNVKVSGSDEGWGCNVFTTSFSPPQLTGYTFVGNSNITNAQFSFCGQTDTNYSPIQFNQLNFPNSNQLIDGVSLYDNNYMGINIDNSANINIYNTTIYATKKTGVAVKSSTNVTLLEVSVIQLTKRYFPPQIGVNMVTDLNSCFSTCVEGSPCKNFNIINSTCAGSEGLGILVPTFNCSVDLSNNYNYLNAYATVQAGVWFFNVNSGSNCFKSGNVIVYNNLGTGYASFNAGELSLNENIISSNNLYGITIISGSNLPNPRKQLKNSIILGQNKENPICFTQNICGLTSKTSNLVTNPKLCIQTGMFMSVTLNGGAVNMPITDENIPVHNVMSNAQFGSFFDGINITIVNFEDQCDISQIVFNTNDFATDSTSVHNFQNLTLSRVLEDNLFTFTPPSPGWQGIPCGAFPCSGPNNFLLRISSFKQSQALQKNSEIVKNPKWTTIKKFTYPDFNLTGSNIAEQPNYPLYTNSTIVPVNINLLNGCINIKAWSANLCNNSRSLGVLIVENIEPEANTRTISPMNYTSLDPAEPFNNAINMFSDHGCENGYPTHKRVPRMVGALYLNKSYNLTFASTNPTIMKMQLTDPNWVVANNGTNQIYTGVTMKIRYMSPQTVLVYNFNTGAEYKSIQWPDGSVFNGTTCGSNKWTPVNNTLEFYITNSPDCVLMMKQVDSVQMSLRFDMTVEDFYSRNAATSLIYNIATVLGISFEQIRITSVMKGSAIVFTSVLASDPAQTPGGGGSPTATTTGTTSSGSPAKTIDLNAALNTIVTSIKSGVLPVPANVLSMTAILTTSAPPPSFNASSNSSSSSSTGSTGIGIIIGNGTIININVAPITPNNGGNDTNTISSVYSNNGVTIIVFNNTTPSNNNPQTSIPNPHIL